MSDQDMDRRGTLWNAINRYTKSCGGDTGLRTVNKDRMKAVAEVERVVFPRLMPPQPALPAPVAVEWISVSLGGRRAWRVRVGHRLLMVEPLLGATSWRFQIWDDARKHTEVDRCAPSAVIAKREAVTMAAVLIAMDAERS